MTKSAKFEFELWDSNNTILDVGDAERIREKVSELVADKFGFHVMLEHDQNEDGMTIFLHSDNDDDLSPSQIKTLERVGIIIGGSEEKNHKAIMNSLGTSICYMFTAHLMGS